MKRLLLALALAVATGLLAGGSSRAEGALDGPVDDLASAVDDRIDAIESGSDADKAALKEAKKLSKARTVLEGYAGDGSLAGLKTLSKGIKGVAKSGTEDEGVLGALESVVAGLLAIAQDEALLAEASLGMLGSEKFQGKIQKFLSKYGVTLGQAEALLEDDPAKSAKFIVKALLGYGKAEAKAQAFLRKELRDLPPPRACDGDVHGTMTATVGGDAFTGVDEVKAWWTQDSRGGQVSFSIWAYNWDNDESITINWSHTRNDSNTVPAVGTYQLSWPPGLTTSHKWHIDVDGDRWENGLQFEAISGTLVIEEFNLVDQTISGTFEFEGQVYNQQKFITVTGGSFDITCIRRD